MLAKCYFPCDFPCCGFRVFIYSVGQKQSVVIMDRNGIFHMALSVLFFGSKAERKKQLI
jgi:hypothetical protein